MPKLLRKTVFLCGMLLFLCGITLTTQAQSTPKFKVIAFYSASFDVAHISFSHEACGWFAKLAEEQNFQFDSTKNWNNLNAGFLANYDVVMFFDDQPQTAAQRSAFQQYMQNGGGFIGFHVCAFNTNPADWDWYHNQFLATGAFKTNTWGPSKAVIKVEDNTHPATVGLPAKFTSAVSEWYGWTKDLRTNPNIRILCSIDPSSFPLGTDPNQSWYSGYYPVVWANKNYKMIYCNFGHNDIDYAHGNATKSYTFSNPTQNNIVINQLRTFGAAATIALPGTLQAEAYDVSSGIRKQACTDAGGGLNIGYIDAGDWLDYKVNVTSSGSYKVEFRVASLNGGGTLQLKSGNTTLSTINVPPTAGWQTWTTVSTTVNLSAGTQTLRLQAGAGGYNINWIKFSSDVLNQTPTVSLTSPASNSSFSAPASITLSATAADTDGTITKVDFYNGNTLLNSDASAPYSYTWNGVAAGTYSLSAVATDNLGATKTSTVASVSVTTPIAPIKEYTINKTLSPITIDGVLDEAGWITAPVTDNLLNMNGTTAAQVTNAKMLWSDTHLYFAFTIQDNSMWATLTTRDAQLWTQDVLEVLIDKDGDAVNYTELGFGPNGSLYDLVMDKPYSTGGTGNSAWNINGLDVKTKITGTINSATGGVQWVCEVALPFAGIPATPTTLAKPNVGDVWRLNIARADHNYNDANSEKLYTWTYTDGVTNHLPSRFGKVTFGNTLGNMPPTVTITSPLNNATLTTPATLTITANAIDADGMVAQVDFYNGATLLGSDNTAPYSYTWSAVPVGNYTLTAKATDDQAESTTSSIINISVTAPVCLPASASTDDGNVAANVIDNNLNTRWSASGDGQWIQFCLDNEQDVSGVQIAFYSGNVRQSIFDVQTSLDGSDWSPALSGVRSSGTSLALENFTFTTRTSKYVRITGHGNSINAWNSFTEVKFLTGPVVALPNKFPTVSLTSPVNNTNFNAPASITINATAADADGTVTKVEFYNGATLIGTDLTAPFSYSWTAVPVGIYTLTAKATDDSLAVTTSSSISVTVVVPPNQAPTVSITSPTNNASFNAPASITINATAADAEGPVTKVEFYNGTTLLGTDATSPFTYTWTSVAAGTYTLSAKATDNAGAVTTSASVSVKVNTVVTNLCSGIATYKENGGYAAGSIVQNGGARYQCKPWPASGWCNGAAWAYAPGTGSVWGDAWTKLGNCSSSARTSSVDANESNAMMSNTSNPFSESTNIEVIISEASDVSIKVYDRMGNEVGTLFDGYLTPGKYQYTFVASGLKADMYLVKLNTSYQVETLKIIKSE